MIAMIPPNRPNLIKGPAAACLALLLCACVTQTKRVPPDVRPVAVAIEGVWDVELAGNRVGKMTRMRIPHGENPQTLYKVEHADGQHAGYIDLQGRAWRHEPFREGLVLVGMDTMAEDLRILLELAERPDIRRVAETIAAK